MGTSIFHFHCFYSSFLAIISFRLISLASAEIFCLLTSILSSTQGQAQKFNLQPNSALTSFILTAYLSPDKLSLAYLAK